MSSLTLIIYYRKFLQYHAIFVNHADPANHAKFCKIPWDYVQLISYRHCMHTWHIDKNLTYKHPTK